MKKFASLLIFLLTITASQKVCSQSCPKIFIESQYKIENNLKMSTDLSQEYTIIGMNREALIEEDKFYENGNFGLGDPKCLISKDSNLKAIPALNYLSNKLKDNDIVILNECHNFPQNRVFFYNLLDSLKGLGFNSLFIETLAYVSNDSSYQKKNGINEWGYYTIENVFQQVLRKLKEMNYNLYSYEVSYPRKIDTTRMNQSIFFVNKSEPKWIPIKADSLLLSNFFSSNDNIQRETEQALNIYQKIKNNHLKKAFIYCGYTHAFKSTVFMAGMLKHLLNKDVYSIDQMYLREHSQRKYENSLYTKFAITSRPFVIVDKNNNSLHTIRHTSKEYITDTLFDVAVGMPRSTYINNRPTWLELDGDRKRYALKQFINANGLKDYLVAIYDIKNDQKCIKSSRNEPVPVDVFQVFGDGNNYDAILLPNKEYQLRIYKNGETIIDKIIQTYE